MLLKQAQIIKTFLGVVSSNQLMAAIYIRHQNIIQSLKVVFMDSDKISSTSSCFTFLSNILTTFDVESWKHLIGLDIWVVSTPICVYTIGNEKNKQMDKL